MSTQYEQLNKSRGQFYGYIIGSVLSIVAIMYYPTYPDDQSEHTLRLGLTILFFGALSSFFWSFAQPLRDYMMAQYEYGLRHAHPDIKHYGKTFAYRLGAYLTKLVYLIELLIIITTLRVLSPWPEFDILLRVSSILVLSWWISLFAIPIYFVMKIDELKNIMYYNDKLKENISITDTQVKSGTEETIPPLQILGPARFLAGGFEWRLEDFYTNCITFGGIGTGKTLCVLNTLLEGVLASTRDMSYPPSGLILDPKGDFYGKIKKVCQKQGRLKDLVVLDPDNPKQSFRWNPFDNDEDALENAENFVTTLETTEDSDKETEKFFPQQAKVFIRHAIALVRGTNPPANPPSLVEINALAGNQQRLYGRLFIAHAVMLLRLLAEEKKSLSYVLEMADDLSLFAEIGDRVPRSGIGRKIHSYAVNWIEMPNEERTLIVDQIHDILSNLPNPPRIKDMTYSTLLYHHTDNDQQKPLKDAIDYFLNTWLPLADRARTSVQATIQNMTDPFTMSPYDTLFSSHSNASMGEIIEQGKILYVHMPIEKRPAMTRVICTFIKLEFFRAVRLQLGRQRPTFFLCDEFQSFFSVGANKGDANFFEFSRQSNHLNIIATQNINALLRQAKGNEAAVKNFIPHCKIQIFLQNEDQTTNKHGATLSKDIIINKPSTSKSNNSGTISDQSERTQTFSEKDFLRLTKPSKEEHIDHAEALVYIASASRSKTLYERLYWKVHPI